MRVRHFGPFPFRWYTDASGTNDAAIEPLTITLKEAVEWWWRLQALTVAVTVNATVHGSADTLTRSIEAVRGVSEVNQFTDGDELWLCFQGQRSQTYSASFWKTDVPTVPAAWYGGTPPIDNIVITAHQFLFATPDATLNIPGFFSSSATIERYGTWPNGGSNISLKPAMALGINMFLNPYDTMLPSEQIVITNLPLSGFANNSTVTGTLFGSNITFNIGSTTDAVVTSASIAITKKTWFPYKTHAGTDPVWNSATGAQLLDPRTASVP